MNTLKLTICIATYNRADFIGETLDSIIPQLTEGVEILIVDGASTDNTENVVHDYLVRCGSIRYIRLPFKGGVDQDYNKAVELALGKMCWLFTDDDLLKPGAISAVLAELDKNYSLIVINSEIRNKDLSRFIANSKLQLNVNKVYSEAELEALFKCTIPYLSFIGGVIINKELWMQREKERYYGTEFIHLGVIFQAALPTPALVIAKPFIMIRFGNAQWTSRAFEIWVLKWPKLLCSFKLISEQTRNEYKLTSIKRLKELAIYRAGGTYSINLFNKYISKEDSALWWKLLALLISVIPCFILNIFIKFYLRISNPEALKEWT